MTKGIDISSYQGTVDFDQLKADVWFVISKATEGTGFVDPQFGRNWAETKRVGLLPGAYHFARPDLGTNAQDEATYFLSHLGPLNAPDILALDYEVTWDGDVPAWCKTWLDAVKFATGITPYIYLNRSHLYAYHWSRVIADGYPLWLAAYDGQPSTPIQTPWPAVAIKQWTSTGTAAGINGNVDLNTAFALEEEVTPDQLVAMLNDPAVVEKINTFSAIKEVLAQEAAAIRAVSTTGSHVTDEELARIITIMGLALQKVGVDVAPKP